MFKIKYKKNEDKKMVYENHFYSSTSKDGTSYYSNGKFHREDGPALEFNNGSEEWFINGVRHRENGPAVKFASNGFEEWWTYGVLHREHGPARTHPDGKTEWFSHGLLHKKDGPAIIHADGTMEWYNMGKKRVDPTWDEIYEFTT